MGIIKEFRDFALRGNMVDMAVGIIIGAAFGGLVGSLVANVMMPPLGVIIGGIDFAEFKYVLKAATLDDAGKEKTPAVVLEYGKFTTDFIKFIIQAFAVFLLVKGINTARAKLEKPAAPAPPPGPKAEDLLGEIRDLLKKRPV